MKKQFKAYRVHVLPCGTGVIDEVCPVYVKASSEEEAKKSVMENHSHDKWYVEEVYS